ncbi:MAG: hypothetical protein ACTSQF_11145 [Candidatus Heimdallarchaeaceae archaeon]
MRLRKKPIMLAIILVSMISLPPLASSKINTIAPYQISSSPFDIYADSIVEGISYIYLSGENALGAPDAEYAQIFLEYTNGLLTFDMGRYEKIVNGTGDDFTVHCLSGGYTVKAGNNIQQPLTTIGQGDNTTSFDIGNYLEDARYVQIQYRTGTIVFLDAIEAINLETITYEEVDPIITPVADFWVWDNESKVEFTWEIVETSPWNYTITINDDFYSEGQWSDYGLDFSYTVAGPEELQISLQVSDVHGNSIVDTVNVEIRDSDEASALSMVLSIISLLGIGFISKKRK